MALASEPHLVISAYSRPYGVCYGGAGVLARRSLSSLSLMASSRAQTFETMLKEVVTSKRLSSSKMSSLSDYALKYMKVSVAGCLRALLTYANALACLPADRYPIGIDVISDTQVSAVMQQSQQFICIRCSCSGC